MMATTGADSTFGLLPSAAAAMTVCFASALVTKLIRIGHRFDADGANFAVS